MLLWTIIGHTQNFSGLKDKKLTRVEDAISFTSKPEGSIESVTVISDGENELKIRVEYTGFETAYIIAGTQNGQRLGQLDINNAGVSLQGKTSPIELTLTSSNKTTSGLPSTESPYLEIKVGKTKASFFKRIFLYTLNKKWKREITEINYENLVIPVTLEPIGSAGSLKENEEVLVRPQVKPSLKIATVNPAVLRNMSIKQPINTGGGGTPTPSPPPPQTVQEIDGIWINADPNTRDITKIVVSGNGTSVRVYGSCSPTDCDWGNVALTDKGNKTYSAVFESSFATSTFTMVMGTDLKVNHSRVYKDGRVSRITDDVFKKQQSIYMVYRPMTILTNPTTQPTTQPTTTPENTSTEPQGPDNNPISLWDDLVADNNFEFPYEITNVRMDIYPDKNLRSGVFYYLPDAYHLRWNPDEGYQFRMLYGTGTGATAGNVRMSGTLTPNIGNNEVALVKSLLESYVKSHPNYTYKELRIIPTKSNPKISLSSGLAGQYNIPPDKINVGVQSTIIAPIEVSWVTDSRTKEEMQVALAEGIGVQGVMLLEPKSETVPEQLLPVRITLADTRTLGKFTLQPNKWRNEKWVNKTPFPLKLKFIHALVIEKEGDRTIPLIYSWSLGDAEVPAKAGVTFNALKMPEWLEKKGKTERIWIDYTLVDCESCVNKVLDQLTGGTASSKTKNVTFESFQVFEKLKPARLMVKIRSRQVDPKGATVVELPPVRIEEDMATFSTGPLYLPEGTEPEYEYFFTIVMPDGKQHNSDAWKSSKELELFIGIHTLKEAVSSIRPLIEE